MSATIGPLHNSADTLIHSTSHHVLHDSPEAMFAGPVCLLEGDGTAKGGLNRKALTSMDVVGYPLLEFSVHLGTNLGGNLVKGTTVQFRRTVVGVEPFNLIEGKWKTAALAAGGPATTIIRGRGKFTRRNQYLRVRACPQAVRASEGVPSHQ